MKSGKKKSLDSTVEDFSNSIPTNDDLKKKTSVASWEPKNKQTQTNNFSTQDHSHRWTGRYHQFNSLPPTRTSNQRERDNNPEQNKTTHNFSSELQATTCKVDAVGIFCCCCNLSLSEESCITTQQSHTHTHAHNGETSYYSRLRRYVVTVIVL